jgi:hypothetical protein
MQRVRRLKKKSQSCDSEQKKPKTAAAGVAQSRRSRTLEVFTGSPQGVRASSSEEIRVEKLRRYSTFEIA